MTWRRNQSSSICLYLSFSVADIHLGEEEDRAHWSQTFRGSFQVWSLAERGEAGAALHRQIGC